MAADETYWTKRHIREARQRLVDMARDAKKNAREAVGECHACFYVRGSRIAGQAFTDYTCKECQCVFSHPNTAVPKLCKACATRLGLCRRCRANLAEVAREAEQESGGK